MIEVEAALAKIYQALPQQTATESVSILDAAGRVCGEDILAKVPVPSFPRAGMDGYAVCAKDTQGATANQPVMLQVIGSICAGEAELPQLGTTGTAVRIMTGAPIPEGFDAVIKQEWTDQGESTVAIYQEIQVGKNYSEVGEDVAFEQKIISKYQLINSRGIGILASQGITSIRVLVPMRVGILVTGSELLPLGEPLVGGKIYNSNLYTLAAFIRASGSQLVFMEQAEDDVVLISDFIQKEIKGVDLLITTGGVSVGEKDYLPEVVQSLGAETLFHHVHMKPGTPMMASRYQNRVILHLSGNPFAAMINLHLFYWSSFAHFMNCPSLDLEKRKLPLTHDLVPSTIRRFIRASEKDGLVSLISKKHQSSVFQNTLATNCFIDQPAQADLKQGDFVTVYYWKI